MRITYACPACDATVTHTDVETAESLTCPHCGGAVAVPADAVAWTNAAGGPAEKGTGLPTLRRCLVCPSAELFSRKDFPQRLGVGIVVAGFLASCVTWAWQMLVPTFAILFGTALIDVLLYLLMPECLTCYRCGARYRGAGGPHGGFDLETHERHRQNRIRLRDAAASRSGPTTSPTS
jgi:DNA-directed RNA polymerase subunit RPC12/RpoP